jgi:serine/threonine protein kinase/Tfp pilus assembly protein PilF
MIGTTISHYKILEKIGEGGMGVVYKAQDTKLDRIVALKFLPHDLTADTAEKERFVHEARAASALDHPNIATIYEIDEKEGECFISMAFIEGKSIKAMIEEKTLSLEEILNFSIQIAEGLNAAHLKNIIHRDIKSENIMITPGGIAKITDFGIAKLKDTDPLAGDGVVLGTLEYMSPEQVQGMPVDARSDIFSLGVVMYEMLTGELPFKGEHQTALVYSIMMEAPFSLDTFREDISEEFQKIMDRVLHKEVTERYQNASELLADLKKLQKDPDLWYKGTAKKEAESRPSVAVMYLDNLGGGKEDDYFVAGMTEDIITDLCNIEGLRVLSRSDVLPFRGQPVNVKEIGKKLSVDYVLEGSVRKVQNQLRINAQLVKVSDGFHLWAERFDQELKNVFDLQAEVANKIASALKVKLQPSEIVQMGKKPTFSVEAYDYYLRGRDYYWKLNRKDIEFAINMYQKALDIDTDYALAYAGLADAYVFMYEAYIDRSVLVLEEAEKSSRKALGIDPQLPEAHRSLGRVFMFQKKTEDAIGEFEKAIHLRPNFYDACRTLGWIHEELRNFDEAIRWAQKTLEIRPLDKEALVLLGITHYDQRQYDKALEAFLKATDVAPDYSTAFYYIGSTYLRQGKFDLALERFQKCIDSGCDPNVYLDSGWIYLLQGDYENSIRFFQKSIEAGFFNFLAYYFQGVVYQQTNQPQKSSECFEKSVRLCSEQLKNDPQNPYLHTTLGLAYMISGDETKADEEIVIAHELAPENGAILYDIARYWAMKNNVQRALEFLERALKLPLSPSKIEIRLDPHFKHLLENSAFVNLIRI